MSEQPLPNQESGRILRFRPRQAGPGPGGWRWPLLRQTPAEPPIASLARFQQSEADDDYRHRMMMNALALLVTTVLVVVGLWLAVSIAEMVKNQDCFLQGRRNCEKIFVPRRDDI